MQPEWRGIHIVEGAAVGPEFRMTLEGDWDCLKKTGQNGFVSVLACLAWWGEAMNGEPSSELCSEWETALEECHHVIVSLLAAPSE